MSEQNSPAVMDPEARTRVLKWAKDSTITRIESERQYGTVVSLVKLVKVKWKAVEEERMKITAPINTSLKAANDFFRDPLARLKGAEIALKSAMKAWDMAKEKAALEAQKELEAKADEERKKLQAKADEERKAGDHDAADMTQAIAQTVAAPRPAKTTAPSTGVSYRDQWTAHVNSEEGRLEFLKWALEKKRFEYLLVDVSLLTKEAQASRGTRKWPGVRIIHNRVSSIRA